MVPNALMLKHRELSPCWIEGFVKLFVSIVIITTAEIIEQEDMRMILIFIWFGLSGVTDLLVLYEHETDKHASMKMLIVAFLMEAVFLQMKVSSASMKQYDLIDFLLEISICCVILCLIAGLIIKRLQLHIVTSTVCFCVVFGLHKLYILRFLCTTLFQVSTRSKVIKPCKMIMLAQSQYWCDSSYFMLLCL